MTKIELTPRKKQVLKAIVMAYLETGEPIGSKILTGLIENAPSSATLRNEMSELSQMGLLEQPHTSAGRIPTNDGLKLYIKNLMPNLEIGKSEKEFIDNAFEGLNDIPEKLPAAAGKIISDLTGLPVITCLITEATTAIKKVEVLPISRNSVMLLIITNDGRTRNRILRIGNDFTSDLFERFKHITELPEKIPAKAAEILSDLTHLPVIACVLTPDTATVKKVELLNITHNTVMLLVVMSDSRTRNRIFRLSDDFTPELLEKFKQLVDTKIKGRPLKDLCVGYMQSIVTSQGLDAFKLMPLFTALFDTANEIENTAVDLSGVSRLYNICGNEEKAKRIISLVERRDPIISLFECMGNGVVFGKDTGYNEFQSDTLIAAKFTSDKYKGYIALIGPNRLSYEQLIPTIEYTAEKLSEVITAAQKDMED